VDVYENLVPQIKELIIKSMHAVRKKLDPFKRRHTFELFGYDFILDEDYNVWLIEVNTNPCIEESSQLLKILLPRMIEDMLRLTVDRSFPKNKKYKATSSGKKGSVQSTLGSPMKSIKLRQLDRIPEEHQTLI
jgi:Tubulin-tyrosine ligase family